MNFDTHTTHTMASEGISPQMVVTTSLVALVSGFLLGVYAIRGYVISPELKKEREGKWTDPVESEESDIDEDDTILDHAPNWTNGEEADRRQGLRASVSGGSNKPTPAPASASAAGKLAAPKGNEECKLVLVVRTDLGMTKGIYVLSPFFPSRVHTYVYTHTSTIIESLKLTATLPSFQAKSQRNAATRRWHATKPSSAPRKRTPHPPRPSCFASGSVWARPRSRCRSRARTRCSS